MGRSSALDWVRGKRIGEGCFGTVSLGVNRSDGRVFAVKSVDRATCFPSQLEALEREIRILRSLSSPYVAQYLGDDESCENSTSFRNLHVAYVPGGRTIADAAARDEETVRSLTWCLVSALKHVHSKGFVHCDVKGRNVLIGPGLNRATLVDFGSAAEIGAPTPLRGSPLWMAPEVVRGESQGTESDVWSLGCTVLEIVTGRPAWEDRGGETLRTIGFSDALPEFPPELSESADDFIRKCLQRDPKKRWSCERLLRHPFLAGAAVPEEDSSAPGLSPRCVLDCDFDDDDVEEDRSGESSARERIGKLAGIGGVNWEAEGWTVVREFGREGVVSEFSNSSRVEREGLGTSSEYHPKFGASLCCRDGQRKCHNLMVAWLSTLYNFNIIITVLLFVKKFNELITSYTSLQFANITRHTDKFYRL